MTDTAAAQVGGRFGLGRVTQISFGVDDYDRALPMYEALFGPFRTWRAEVSGDTFRYRGVPSGCTLRIGLGRCGDVDIELIAVEGGQHPISEHVSTIGHGLHHVAFEVDDLDGRRAAMEAEGFVAMVEGTTSNGIRFCHLQAPELLGFTTFELMQLPRTRS